MKKVFKIVLIVLLCVAVAGGTGYLFFINMDKSVSVFNSVNEFVLGSERKQLRNDISKVGSTGGNRFNLLLDVYDDLNDISFNLNAYLVNYSNRSSESKLAKKISTLTSEQSTLKNMADEYFVKSKNTQFNKVAGADDFYEALANYLVNYANFVNELKAKVLTQISSSNIDLKFSVFDVYLNVVANDLSTVKANTTNNFDNINYMVKRFSLQNGYIKTIDADGSFGQTTNKFISTYNKCNKEMFAKHLATNVATATESSTSVELIASYMLKTLIGAI